MTEGVSKKNMGRFFGENIEKNKDIFCKFCGFLDFKDV
jgi:Sec7-like guanine-nucleotide exchange factor